LKIEEMIERSHAMAVEKGWWDGGERSVVDQVNNFHAEISEAWEEYRAGRMDTWYSRKGERGETWTSMDAERHYSQTPYCYVENGWKPEGFWIEIADLCIRLADTMGAYGWTYRDLRPSDCSQLDELNWSIPRLVSTLHICVGCLGIDDNGDIGGGWETGCQRSASGAIHLCMMAAKFHGVDLLALCELKMAYNATQSHRHGGKKA
jgi:hypothetical protein